MAREIRTKEEYAGISRIGSYFVVTIYGQQGIGESFYFVLQKNILNDKLLAHHIIFTLEYNQIPGNFSR